ncbi:MAG: hypothetical protein M1826_006231 [Phylliscum demangeonii]|nr:MAG: hypothetical protein M1826_006231 [Phylliscum demangeonii]
MMSSHRAPLANIPNAVNSPRRPVAADLPTGPKRSRSRSTLPGDVLPPPPVKRVVLDQSPAPEPISPSPQRRSRSQLPDGRVFSRRPGHAQMTPFEKRLLAVRELDRREEERRVKENVDSVRQWQKHYRKVFPHFVFYLENIPPEARSKCSKQLAMLGAKEERFFSKAITHVVTTRPIPPASELVVKIDSARQPPNLSGPRSQVDRLRTINPVLLERSSESTSAQAPLPPAGRFIVEAPHTLPGRPPRNAARYDPVSHFPRRPVPMSVGSGLLAGAGETKKLQVGIFDVLHKAREMGMKIWALEKFQRMMAAMFETSTPSQATHNHNTRSHAAQASQVGSKLDREAQLSQLLREERLNGPADRDPRVANKELITFKGPFIYVHDVFEKVKPIMVRDYAKAPRNGDGAWPQFRSSDRGRCPFIEDPNRARLAMEQAVRAKERKGGARDEASAVGANQVRAAGCQAMPPPPGQRCHPVEVADDPRRMGPEHVEDGRENHPARENHTAHSWQGVPGHGPGRQEYTQPHGGLLFLQAQPVASGIQPSNITSAIRSQMISSTAAAPGAKGGTNKEVYGLKRKLLDKHSAPGASGWPSRPLTDISSNMQHARGQLMPRTAKLRAQQRLGHIDEETIREHGGGAGAGNGNGNDPAMAGAAGDGDRTKRAVLKRDPKPGYCENCRDKFDDFDEHVVSRNHRRFAMDIRNWRELDGLLEKLARPLKGCEP